MKQFVIVHSEWGVYLGSFMGLGFFSLIDCAGQEEAAVFDTEKAARDYVATWEENNEPESYCYVEVTATGMWATIDQLEAAGLGHLVNPMKLARLENISTAGSA